MSSSPIIIAVTGLPLSGKGTFNQVAKRYKFKRFVMGDVIRNECKKRGIEINRKNSDIIMMELREQNGLDAIAVITQQWIASAVEKGEKRIMIDGVRSISEINYFKKFIENLIVIGIHASQQTRLGRALNRRRVDDAFSSNSFIARDQLELNIGIGDVIALSNILIISDGDFNLIDSMYKEVLEEILTSSEDEILAEQ